MGVNCEDPGWGGEGPCALRCEQNRLAVLTDEAIALGPAAEAAALRAAAKAVTRGLLEPSLATSALPTPVDAALSLVPSTASVAANLLAQATALAPADAKAWRALRRTLTAVADAWDPLPAALPPAVALYGTSVPTSPLVCSCGHDWAADAWPTHEQGRYAYLVRVGDRSGEGLGVRTLFACAWASLQDAAEAAAAAVRLADLYRQLWAGAPLSTAPVPAARDAVRSAGVAERALRKSNQTYPG